MSVAGSLGKLRIEPLGNVLSFGMPAQLRLRPVRRDDEDEFLSAHELMLEGDDFPFALSYDIGMDWQEYVLRLEQYRRGIDLPEGIVPAALLVADVGGAIVGRTSIRHRLNEWLTLHAGHIGYGVLPEFRRKGYATEMLRQSLVIARSVGVEKALLTCDDANVGSATVIESCGGVLESVTEDGLRRYWID